MGTSTTRTTGTGTDGDPLMAEKRTEELPLTVIELVETPPAKPTGRRHITDLEENTAIKDDDILLLQRGNRTFKITKANLFTGFARAYAELHVQDGDQQSPVVTQTPGTSPVLYTGFDTDGQSYDAVPDQANNKITITTAGVYCIHAQISWSGTNNSTWHIVLYRDLAGTPTESHIHCTRKLGSSGDVGSGSLLGILSLNAGEEIGIYVSSGVGTDVMNTYEAQFGIIKIG